MVHRIPRFGQFLNQKYIKGGIFLFLELLINVQANFNQAIISNFHGNIEASIDQIEYQWLMFYPCLYCFSMWDAYKDAGGRSTPFSAFPFIFASYSVTIGLIFSSTVKIFGMIFGPVFLPMLFVIP